MRVRRPGANLPEGESSEFRLEEAFDRQPALAGSGTASAVPEPAEVLRQLDRILASEAFQVSPRHRRFLGYVVTETVEGRADRIKAYAIATEVFGRDANFDAQNDPIVRVEAGHLRRALERYYLGAGASDPIEITIPKGSYVPRFDRRGSPAPKATEAGPAAPSERRAAAPLRRGRLVALAAVVLLGIAVAAWSLVPGADPPARPDVPHLVVEPFEDLSQAPGSAGIAEGLTHEVVGQIAKFRDIVVLSPDWASPGTTAAAPPRYSLEGAVDLDAETVRLQARLVSREDGSILWAESYAGDVTVSRMIEIQRDIADKVATALAQPYGVIFQADASRQVARPPVDWSAYACTLSYYAYRSRLDAATHPVVRDCLKEAVARFPAYATAWGLLSQVYIDELRFRFAPDPDEGPASVDRALAAARKAVELDPTNVRGLQAEMFALYFAGDIDAALRVGRRALEINPNDTELRGEVGYRLALSGEWEPGCDLVRSARTHSSGPPGYYESALALCAYQRGDLAEATMWIRNLPLGENPQYHLIAAVVYGEAGNPGAATEIAWMRDHAPHLYTNTRAEIALRVRRPEDVDRFLASLEKAGLPVEE